MERSNYPSNEEVGKRLDEFCKSHDGEVLWANNSMLKKSLRIFMSQTRLSDLDAIIEWADEHKKTNTYEGEEGRVFVTTISEFILYLTSLR